MAAPSLADEALTRADALTRAGDPVAAIALLTEANRDEGRAEIERALVRLRRQTGREQTGTSAQPPLRVTPATADGRIVEVAGADLDVAQLLDGLATSGCLLVRGLITPERARELAAGIDRAFDAYDRAEAGEPSDLRWYEPHTMPDRVEPGLPAPFRRRMMRDDGGMWTADSPRMLYEVLEVIERSGLVHLMADLFHERPLLSAIKGTLRRVAPFNIDGGWHQDGAFLGDQISSLNVWLSLSRCGDDAPGLDIVPRRLPGVLPRDERAQFDWSVSDAGAREAADGVAIVRPLFEPGDALLFDHLLLHRTGADARMPHDRYAIESWFFAPSAYPDRQLPIYV